MVTAQVNVKIDSTQASKSVGELNSQINKATGSFTSMKAELRAITQELQGLQAGSARFQELSQRAGVSLKDYFNEDKLSQLDHTSLNHDYINQEVYDRVTIDSSVTDYDVRYPLISSKRIWQFSGSVPLPQDNCPEWFQYPTNNSDNIGDNAGEIEYQELFPAVRGHSQDILRAP